MRKNQWTLKEAIGCGLIFDCEKVNFSRLYPDSLKYYFIAHEESFFANLSKIEQTGRFDPKNMSIRWRVTLYSVKNETVKNKTVKFLETLLSNEAEIKATVKDIEDRSCIVIDIRLSDKIIVKFENNDEDVYFELPERELFQLP